MGRNLVLGFALAYQVQFGITADARVTIRDLLDSHHNFGTFGLRTDLHGSHVGAFRAGHGRSRGCGGAHRSRSFVEHLAKSWGGGDAICAHWVISAVGGAGNGQGGNSGGNCAKEICFHIRIFFRVVLFIVGFVSRHP